mgnify:CR=1 FL=1
MNNLSWALYLTDVCQSLSNAAAAITLVSAMAAAIAAVFYFASMDCAAPKVTALALSAMRKLIPTCFVSMLVMIVVPSKETMRMILVSEYGERLYNSKDGQEIINPAKELLKRYIQEQLDAKEKK